MSQRSQVALQGEPGIIVDLCTLNSGHPGDIFEEFFVKMEEIVNEVTAPHILRHGTAHLSQWLLLEDLIEQVNSKCPKGTRVPSKGLVGLQFAPQSPYTQRVL